MKTKGVLVYHMLNQKSVQYYTVSISVSKPQLALQGLCCKAHTVLTFYWTQPFDGCEGMFSILKGDHRRLSVPCGFAYICGVSVCVYRKIDGDLANLNL